MGHDPQGPHGSDASFCLPRSAADPIAALERPGFRYAQTDAASCHPAAGAIQDNGWPWGALPRFTAFRIYELSSYLREHIRRFGQYVLDVNDRPPPLEPKLLTISPCSCREPGRASRVEWEHVVPA